MQELIIKREDIGYLRLLIDLAKLDEEKSDNKNKQLIQNTRHKVLINRKRALFGYCL